METIDETTPKKCDTTEMTDEQKRNHARDVRNTAWEKVNMVQMV
jgi:hypothetical protein